MVETIQTIQTTQKTVAKRKPHPHSRPRPTHALAFTVWAENGSPLPSAAVVKIEEAITRAQFELFNAGIRILTQTTRG